MNCLPIINRFGRILSKMFLTTNKRSSSFQRLVCDDNKENIPFDYNTSYLSSSSLFTTGSSENLKNQPESPSVDNQAKNSKLFTIYTDQNMYFNPYDDSLQSSPPNSSGYESFDSKPRVWTDDKIKIFKDQLNTSIDSLLSFINDFSLDDHEEAKAIPYSRLSSYNETEYPVEPETFHSFNNFTSSLLTENRAYHNELRRDFDMNGRTLEMTESSFTPQTSSTPMVNRKSNHWQPEPSRITCQSSSNYDYKRNKIGPKMKFKPRFKPNKKSLEDHCVFCKNNGAHESVYKKHTVKDAMGNVICPTLRHYKCPICGAEGDKSHTVKYCPKKPIVTMEDIHRMDRKIRSKN